MKNDNKQRLTLLTKREKNVAVAAAGGWLDRSIPEAKVRARLVRERGTFDNESLLECVKSSVALLRMQSLPIQHESPARGGKRAPRIYQLKPELESSEVILQARDTRAVALELCTRLQHLHPDIEASIPHELEPIATLLSEFADALESAEQRLAPARTGPKANAWTATRDKLASTLRSGFTPMLPQRQSLKLAEDVLKICGHPSPRKPRTKP